jgi:hypothetical protein
MFHDRVIQIRASRGETRSPQDPQHPAAGRYAHVWERCTETLRRALSHKGAHALSSPVPTLSQFLLILQGHPPILVFLINRSLGILI